MDGDDFNAAPYARLAELFLQVWGPSPQPCPRRQLCLVGRSPRAVPGTRSSPQAHAESRPAVQLFGHTDLVLTDIVCAFLMLAEWQREQRQQLLDSILGPGAPDVDDDDVGDGSDKGGSDDEGVACARGKGGCLRPDSAACPRLVL